MTMKMCVILALCLQICVVYSAPLQLQMLPNLPYQGMPFQPVQMRQNLQQQLLEMQAIQQLNPLPQYGMSNQPQPFLILLPDELTSIIDNTNEKINEQNENETKLSQQAKIDEDLNSVIIDAEPNPIPTIEGQKAILMLPNARLSIGDFISAIPWLPIEINVPDTVSWAYNGISNGIAGIISIIGQRLPFQRPPESPMKGISLKSTINDVKLMNQNMIRPLVVMPLGFNQRFVPMQLQ